METNALGITPEDRARYERDGFLVREGVLTPAEVEDLRGACEELCEQLAQHSRNERKFDVSEFYVFETDALQNVMIKWEPGARDVIQGIEPVVHLHPVIAAFASHVALTEPARDFLGVDAVGLFTEKLNVKRAGVGGAYALHRDFPYWEHDADDVHSIITVSLALDDSTAANGALEVLPRSHLIESPPFKDSELEFERNELDPDRMDTTDMVPVEMPAGSAVFFGPMLIHRSAANTSDQDRRALLFSYQRAGLKDQRRINREWFEKYGVARR